MGAFFALAVSAAAVPLAGAEKRERLSVLFLVCGMLTSCMDFLTAETLTLTFPLLLTLYIRRGRETRENLMLSLKTAVLWGAGYVLMWVLKWLFAAAVLGEDVTPYISEHIAERIGGREGITAYIAEALRRNIFCLFPVGNGGIGIAATVILVIVAAYICFVYRKPDINGRQIMLYAVIGAVHSSIKRFCQTVFCPPVNVFSA